MAPDNPFKPTPHRGVGHAPALRCHASATPLRGGITQAFGRAQAALTTGVVMNSNLDVVRGVYQAFAVGDIPSVLGALSPNVQWTEAAGGPYGGVSIGPNAVLENVFMRIGPEWDGFAAVPSEFIADGSTVVALGEYSGTYKATGKSFNTPFAHVWKFDGGKAASFSQYTDTVIHMQPLQP